MPTGSTTPRIEQERAYFDSPEAYLGGNSNIPARAEIIKGMLEGRSFAKFAGLGCGAGSIAVCLLNGSRSLTLVDSSPNMIERTRAEVPSALRANVELHVDDAGSFGGGRKHDLARCVGVLAHLTSVDAFVANLCGLVQPGGMVVVRSTDASTARACVSRIMRCGGSKAACLTNRMTERTIPTCFAAHGTRISRVVTCSEAGIGVGGFRRSLASRFSRSSLVPLA
jgi:trans-aconitate methyltransferase